MQRNLICPEFNKCSRIGCMHGKRHSNINECSKVCNHFFRDKRGLLVRNFAFHLLTGENSLAPGPCRKAKKKDLVWILARGL